MAKLLTKHDRFYRGYDAAVECINAGGDPQDLYNTAEADPDQDSFTRGWQRACFDKGAKSE